MIKMRLHIKIAEFPTTPEAVAEITGMDIETIKSYCDDNCKTINIDHIELLRQCFDNCKDIDLIELDAVPLNINKQLKNKQTEPPKTKNKVLTRDERKKAINEVLEKYRTHK